jgi:hypothetical protein
MALMKSARNERGAVLVIELVVLAVVIAVAGIAAIRYYEHRKAVGPAISPVPRSTSSGAPAPDPTTGWTTFSATVGKYSLRYKPGWKTQYCTYSGSDNLQLELSADKLIACNTGGSTAHIQMQISTGSGNLSDYDVADAGFTETKTDVTVDGVAGHRYEGVKGQKTALNYPPVGTKCIKYVLAANGRNYLIKYCQQPGDADASADFELMVKNTLEFAK